MAQTGSAIGSQPEARPSLPLRSLVNPRRPQLLPPTEAAVDWARSPA
ncbi:MAG: hypothetical protein H0X65_04395 [Gemmatimonadetes bacterium]|nr:hypothetical protein [Gemmatimonadota bacterium]